MAHMIASNAFRISLARAARLTIRTGHESTFQVYGAFGAPGFLVTDVHEGTTDRIPAYVYDNIRRELPKNVRSNVVVLDAHFHPEATGRLEISANDLFRTEDTRCGSTSRPIVAIGKVDDERAGYLALLQGRFTGQLYPTGTTLVLDYLERLDTLGESTLEPSHYRPILEMDGYMTADVLRFRLPRRADGGRGAILENPRVIERFNWPMWAGLAPRSDRPEAMYPTNRTI